MILSKADDPLGEGIFRTTFDSLLILNREGKIQRCNPAFHSRLGWELHEVLGLPIAQFLRETASQGDDSEDLGWDVTLDHLIREGLLRSAMVHMRHGQGHFVPMLASANRFDADGLIVFAAKDLTDLQRTEALLYREREEFQRRRLAALESMAGAIAHEINNPLAIISGFAHQLSRYSPDRGAEQLATAQSRIQEGVRRIAAIIQKIKVFMRDGEDVPMVRTNLAATVREVLALFQERLATHDIDLTIDTPTETIMMVGQDIRISQALMHVVTNAVDAVRSSQRRPRWLRIELREADSHVSVAIVDSGLGVPKEARDKILLPFFSTKGVNQGAGIGLSFARRVCEDHGGSLRLDENSLNTKFVLTLAKGGQAAPSPSQGE